MAGKDIPSRPKYPFWEEPEVKKLYLSLTQDRSIDRIILSKFSVNRLPEGKTIDDIKSDAFLGLSEFMLKNEKRDPKELKNYFLAICRNLIAKLFKGHSNKEQLLEGVKETVWISDQEFFQGESLEERERDKYLRQAWNELSPECQERLSLKFEEGLRASEIAERTGISSTKKLNDRMSECYAKFRKLIESKPQFGLLNKHLRKKKK